MHHCVMRDVCWSGMRATHKPSAESLHKSSFINSSSYIRSLMTTMLFTFAGEQSRICVQDIMRAPENCVPFKRSIEARSKSTWAGKIWNAEVLAADVRLPSASLHHIFFVIKRIIKRNNNINIMTLEASSIIKFCSIFISQFLLFFCAPLHSRSINKALHFGAVTGGSGEGGGRQKAKDVMKNKHPRLMLSTFVFITGDSLSACGGKKGTSYWRKTNPRKMEM